MILLVLFAFVAGAGTALSPCVLPVLPALLASAGSGGRRRPLGVIAGLTATFTIAIVALASLVDGVGLPGGTVRTLGCEQWREGSFEVCVAVEQRRAAVRNFGEAEVITYRTI